MNAYVVYIADVSVFGPVCGVIEYSKCDHSCVVFKNVAVCV